MEQTDLRVKVTPASQIKPEDSDEVMELLAAAYGNYGDGWMGDDVFKNARLKNATEMLRIYNGHDLAASLLFDHDRISIIAVRPDSQGQGLGVRLFEEAAKVHPNVWITVGLDSDGMIATLTSNKLNFSLVEDKLKIEDLFRATNQGRDHFKVEAEEKEIPFLSERLKEKGIYRNSFMAYSREGGTHAANYHQIVFQNQPKSSI